MDSKKFQLSWEINKKRVKLFKNKYHSKLTKKQPDKSKTIFKTIYLLQHQAFPDLDIKLLIN